jgi:uncharacterized protein YjiK
MHLRTGFFRILPMLGLLLAACAVAAPSPGNALAGYRLQMQVRVQGVDDNLSGLAYDAAGNRLLAVVNRPESLLVLDRDGKVQRRIALHGFVDTEGVAVLGGDRVAVTEEALNRIAIFRLPPVGTDRVDHADAQVLQLDLFKQGNSGFEGLAYDARSNCLWLVKEKAPRGLFTICGPGTRTLVISDRSGWLARIDAGTDLSGIAVDPASGHLLLLSDESKRITEIDRHGRVVAHRILGGANEPVPPQPEGIVLDGAGHLYVVSEPDRFYRFGRD